MNVLQVLLQIVLQEKLQTICQRCYPVHSFMHNCKVVMHWQRACKTLISKQQRTITPPSLPGPKNEAASRGANITDTVLERTETVQRYYPASARRTNLLQLVAIAIYGTCLFKRAHEQAKTQ
jgi:hypothetical protein